MYSIKRSDEIECTRSTLQSALETAQRHCQTIDTSAAVYQHGKLVICYWRNNTELQYIEYAEEALQ